MVIRMSCPPLPVYCETCGSKLKPWIVDGYDKCTGKKIINKEHLLFCPRCYKKNGNKISRWGLFPDHIYTCKGCGAHEFRTTIGLYSPWSNLEHTARVEGRDWLGRVMMVNHTHTLVDCSVCGSWYYHGIHRY